MFLLAAVSPQKNFTTGIQTQFQREGLAVQTYDSAERALEAFLSSPPDALLTDFALPGMTGLELCRKVKAHFPHVPVVVLIDPADRGVLREALKDGAFDILEKPVTAEQLTESVNQALCYYKNSLDQERRMLELKTANQQLLKHLMVETHRVNRAESTLDHLRPAAHSQPVFNSELRQALKRLAQSNSRSAVVHGEMGTGKATMARYIHEQSLQQDQAFLSLDCRNGELVEKHWGLHSRQSSIFEAGVQGTVLLKAIHRLKPSQQKDLLQLVRDGQWHHKMLDVRVIGTSHYDLTQLGNKMDRELVDILMQSNIGAPPLRDRNSEMSELAEHVLFELAQKHQQDTPQIHDEVVGIFQRFPWMGNFHELINVLEDILLSRNPSTIMPHHLPAKFQPLVAGTAPASTIPLHGQAISAKLEPFREAKLRAVRDFEEKYIYRLLSQYEGNITACAKASGIDRPNFLRLIRKYHVRGLPFRRAS
jgi:two-component system nitrogen regulation response regulator NtrX